MSSQIERSKGTIRFGFNKPLHQLEAEKSKQYLIYLFFSYGRGKRLKYSTGYKSCYNDWIFDKGRVKNKANIKNKDEVNSEIRKLEDEFTERFNKVFAENPHITPKELKHQLDIITGKVNEDPNVQYLAFFEVVDQFLNEKEGRIANVTLRAYKQAKKHLLGYEKYYRTVLTFDSFNMTFYAKFQKYMEAKEYSLNTIGKHIKTIKTFLNYAVSEGYSQNQRFRSKAFKAVKEITTEIYLTEEEIQAFYDKDLTKYPKLSHARDIFLMGCYTGQRVSDYNSFKEDEIEVLNGVSYFKIIQKKNRKRGRKVLCPITKEMWHIMNSRHEGKPPKRIPDKDLNDYIKQIGQMLELDSLNREIKVEYTKGGKFHSIKENRYNLIKSHTARRSFATNKYKAGMNVYDIMLFTGHTTEKEFYKYIRIKDEERASHIAQNGFFNI
ncbi:Site-specific recombinase XerD [Mesonia phycicola]|uniref:Site-specific recombinase XerD n=1 Tax=Mesonia phycicola TaxID=579105 RepID=A0A1M6CJC7_9FLAO|nr:site-specific integrase [Mesonia phycicola]SHI61140.1 Site-specific recombinase XerD [Mesonia phycicola]